ncbi:FAD-binding oxidoreductase [Roseomonas sp. KE2513]|uniref:FAD-binding oxidoreductase n=1 Tax=Roseomonas sp. KE2513 TaxID=2479202 RepID=UPI0018DF6931|nr:FAD-binding oxidoreductase [Roseomonas sp. KE2513]MBI0537271.1 FAD-binding oxidoreductase [Roseomonas sp. KE2513]
MNRYGTAQDLVLGIETLPPDDRIRSGLRSLRKGKPDDDGKQFVIEFEGMLYVVPAVVLGPFSRMAPVQTIMPDLGSVSATTGPHAERRVLHFRINVAGQHGSYARRHSKTAQTALRVGHGRHAQEGLGQRAGRLCDADGTVLMQRLEPCGFPDGGMAMNPEEATELRRIREGLPEAAAPVPVA